MADRTIDFSTLPVSERDECLGAFVGAWGDLEGQLEALTWNMLGLDYLAARAVFANLSGPGQLRELLEAISAGRLSIENQGRLTKLLDRLKTLATKRNRIIHGKWIAHFERDGPFKWWERHYHPADWWVTNTALFGDNQKVNSAYVFKLSQISKHAQEARDLARDVGVFTTEIGKQLYGGWPPQTFAQLLTQGRREAPTG